MICSQTVFNFIVKTRSLHLSFKSEGLNSKNPTKTENLLQDLKSLEAKVKGLHSPPLFSGLFIRLTYQWTVESGKNMDFGTGRSEFIA